MPSSSANEHPALLRQLQQSRPCRKWKNQVSFTKPEARNCGLRQKLANGAGKILLTRRCSLPPPRKYPLQPALCLPLPLAFVSLPATTCCCNTPWTICCIHCHMLAPLNGSCWLCSPLVTAAVTDKCPVILACGRIIPWEMDLL